MVVFFKALPFGIFLTLIIALFMGSGGTSGGVLAIFPFNVTIPEIGIDMTLYWSWNLFLASTALAFAILFLMD
ncbi:hypothetical protein [Aurantiacibacter gangjinensis]|uniref:Uncharacterized protein n=1 Tax=Aurantiacibacter gangjinensis TaxID=502682 RepID=A0A0G9MKU5_9SPHN|nr:hypothetical protein [Aurantiacibacter gangjinensis]APE27228.1 hypothetical protein BMF35_a0399 [Aurantiacibacter gangjinensis]KLE31351.1 hypothetical protein AAW01_07005 [Aurantiacibacter gangjinensis]